VSGPLLSPHPARLELGGRIRALRRSAGLTGTELAERLHVSQSKISKIETGRLAPSAGEVRTIGGALEAPPGTIEELADRAEELASHARRWPAWVPAAPPLRQRMADLEASATAIQGFRAGVVPALLQTADYALQLLRQSRPTDGEAEMEASVATLSRRQALLFDAGRQFEFVMWEAALRQRLCGPSVMAAQLDRLLSLSSLPNVEIGVLGFDVELDVPPLSAFAIFDERTAVVETGSTELVLQDVEEVAFYAGAFASYRRAASFGEEAARLLVRLGEEWRSSG
jgi:transcriptional regulator with XRE-family HTH domain